MGFSSQNGHVGLKVQSIKGTYKDPGAVSPNQGIFIRTRSGALGGNRELLIPDPEIGGNRDVPDAQLGPISYSGEYDIYARMEAMAALLYMGLGAIQVPTINSKTVTNKVITTNVATLTTSASHGFVVGQQVQVALTPPDVAFDGSWVIASTPSGTTFTYATPLTTTVSTAASGGTAVTNGATLTGFTDTIVPASAAIPWVSVEEKVASGFEVFKYTDCKVNTVHFEADANGYLMGTVGLIGLTQQETTATAVAVQRVDTSALLVGTSIIVAWNGATLPAKSFSIDINNNIEDDDFRLGSLFLGDLVEKRREITMGVTIRPQDNTLWKTAMWGGPAASVPGGLSFKDDVQITITSYEDIPGATPGTKYTATFTIPQAIIAPFTPVPSGDDVMENDLEIRAVRPNPATDIISVALKHAYVNIA